MTEFNLKQFVFRIYKPGARRHDVGVVTGDPTAVYDVARRCGINSKDAGRIKTWSRGAKPGDSKAIGKTHEVICR